MQREDQFEPEAVERIIKRALHLENDDSINRHDLIESAREVGISEAVIEQAIEHESAAIRHDRRHRQRHAERIKAFRQQASGAALVITALFLIDLFTPGSWWFQWPLLGMGFALAAKARKLWLS